MAYVGTPNLDENCETRRSARSIVARKAGRTQITFVGRRVFSNTRSDAVTEVAGRNVGCMLREIFGIFKRVTRTWLIGTIL